MINKIYVYDKLNRRDYVPVVAFDDLLDHLLKYDFTYENHTFPGGSEFEDVVFLKIGCYNNCDDILVYIQFNILTAVLRTILLYDKNKYSLNYMIDVANEIQKELLKTNILNEYGPKLYSVYDYQIKFDKYVKLPDNLNDVEDLDNLMGGLMNNNIKLYNIKLYNIYIKLLEVEEDIRKFNFTPDNLLRLYVDDYLKNPDKDKDIEILKLNYKTDFTSIINNVINGYTGRNDILYPQILEEIDQKIKLKNFILYHL